ncbi:MULTISPECIES: transposase [unclassified Chryseobacterium]|uniref:transposase n=1 Tax=unclassified Chryseobacterium TaxID=2593645 RepID=UPI0021CEB9B9|nr:MULTISPECIES: transposase [unclassified Chryseobacterium]
MLYKSREKWTISQKQRAVILFAQYPDLEKAYQLTDGLRKIYNQNIPKSLAMTKLAHWFKEVEEADFKSFSTLRKTIMNHYRDISMPLRNPSMPKSKTLDYSFVE